MLINVVNKKGVMKSKELLSLNLDMYAKQRSEDGRWVVRLNKNYVTAESFGKQEAAEQYMMKLVKRYNFEEAEILGLNPPRD